MHHSVEGKKQNKLRFSIYSRAFFIRTRLIQTGSEVLAGPHVFQWKNTCQCVSGKVLK